VPQGSEESINAFSCACVVTEQDNYYEVEDNEDVLDVDDLKWSSINKDTLTPKTSATSVQTPGGILESTTNAADWQLEVERVMPQLRVTYQTDCKVH